MNEEMANVLVAWWAGHLKTGRRDVRASTWAVLNAPNPVVADHLIEAGKKHRVPAEQVERFEQALKKLLVEGPDQETHRYECTGWPNVFKLTVDYDPQGLLARAAKLAKLPVYCLPWKTTVEVLFDTARIISGDEQGIILYPAGAEAVHLGCVLTREERAALDSFLLGGRTYCEHMELVYPEKRCPWCSHDELEAWLKERRESHAT